MVGNRSLFSSRSFLVVGLVLAAVLGTFALYRDGARAAAPVVVRPSSMNGWAFFDDNGNGGTYGMDPGPGTPPLGSGSAGLAVANTTQGVALGTAAYQGTRLDKITALTYSSYRVSGGPALSISLGFDVDYDVTDLNNAYQGRLTFEPYYTNSVMTGTWQTWNTLTAVGTGNWWSSGAPGNTMCPIGNPCTWSEVLADFPNAGIRNPGGLIFKAGSGWAGFQGNADALTIGVNNADTTYDFEQDLPATATATAVPPTATSLPPTPTSVPAVGGVSIDPRSGGASGRGALPFIVAAAAATVALAATGGFVLRRRAR
jgi:hypothetical protein